MQKMLCNKFFKYIFLNKNLECRLFISSTKIIIDPLNCYIRYLLDHK